LEQYLYFKVTVIQCFYGPLKYCFNSLFGRI